MMEEACDAVAKQVGDRFDEMEQERGLAPTGVNLNGPACTRVPRPCFKLGHDLLHIDATVVREPHLITRELKYNLNFAGPAGSGKMIGISTTRGLLPKTRN